MNSTIILDNIAFQFKCIIIELLKYSKLLAIDFVAQYEEKVAAEKYKHCVKAPYFIILTPKSCDAPGIQFYIL